MSRRRRSSRAPPIPQERRRDPAAAPQLYQLEQFTRADLTRWHSLSERLDEFNREYYFSLESQRAARRPQILDALRQRPAASLQLSQWVRIVPYRYCLEPLSPLGSVRGYGGRFNIGREVGEGGFRFFPALYLASNFQTAYREFHGLDRSSTKDGLTPEELSLGSPDGFLVAKFDGRIQSVFDTRDPDALRPFVEIIRSFEISPRVRQLARQLKMRDLELVRTVGRLQRVLAAKDWRALPAQFDIPAPPQIFGQLLRDAGYEAIVYPSARNDERCVALFPENFRTSESYLRVTGDYPHAITAPTLDSETAGGLLAECYAVPTE